MKTVVAACMALAMAGFASSASADIVTWTLQDVTFNDGGTGSGFFDYDTATGLATNFDIDTTAGTLLPAFHYTTANSINFPISNLFSPDSLVWVTNGFTRYINLAFDGPLSTPGVRLLRTEAPISGSWECNNCDILRQVTGGGATGTAGVPEPAAWALMVVGFGGLGAVLRRRRQPALATV